MAGTLSELGRKTAHLVLEDRSQELDESYKDMKKGLSAEFFNPPETKATPKRFQAALERVKQARTLLEDNPYSSTS